MEQTASTLISETGKNIEYWHFPGTYETFQSNQHFRKRAGKVLILRICVRLLKILVGNILMPGHIIFTKRHI